MKPFTYESPDVPRQRLVASIIASLLAIASTGCASTDQSDQLTKFPDRIRVEVKGALLTEYRFSPDAPQPYCFPLIGPGGAAMTRSFPMESPPGEDHDHPHHRSFWFAHGLVNGHDFWTDRTNSGRIVHAGFAEITSGEFEVIRSSNHWITAKGGNDLHGRTHAALFREATRIEFGCQHASV